MPRWLRSYLFNHSLRYHFVVSLSAGLLFRVLCGHFVYGPQALDDFNHSVTPAYQWLAGLPHNLPEYRSFLLVWTLAGFMRLADWLGYGTPLGELRACYIGLGVLSLSGIVGTYFFVRRSGSRLFAATALYLVALFPLMPFLSTRTFGESVACGLVLLGFGLLEDTRRGEGARWWEFLPGFLALGLATLFRFQVGVLFVSYMGVLFFTREPRGAAAGFVAGLATVWAAALIDHLSGKAPLETLRLYLLENSGGATQFGVQPWYDTWIVFLGLALFPLTLIFWRSFVSLWRNNWRWLAPVLLFVALHSAIPHKEERFLYPIAGLELWMLAWLWSSGALRVTARRLFSRFSVYFLLPVMVFISTVNSQEGSIAPQADASSRYSDALIVYWGAQPGLFHFQDFFVRRPMATLKWERDHMDRDALDEVAAGHGDRSAIVVVTSDAEKKDDLLALAGAKGGFGECARVVRTGSFSDRLLFGLNPKHNQRRRPSWHLVCERFRPLPSEPGKALADK